MEQDRNKLIVLATRNKGKIKELSEMLRDFELEVLGLDSFPNLEDVEETGSTFEENALLKAEYTAQATGYYAIADDSGLCVDALNDAPGVYSARYSGRVENGVYIPATDASNIVKLLSALAEVPEGSRGASFCCAMAAASPDGRHIIAKGSWLGAIGFELRGNNGFGYDPVFVDPASGKHAAELLPEEKNLRSHRFKALQNLLALWPDFWKPLL